MGFQPLFFFITDISECIVSSPEMLMVNRDRSGSQEKRSNLGRFLNFYRNNPAGCIAMLILVSGSTLANIPQIYVNAVHHVIIFLQILPHSITNPRMKVTLIILKL